MSMYALIRVIFLQGILLFALSQQSHGSFKGAHLTYSCLGGQEYEVTLQKLINFCETSQSPSTTAEYIKTNTCNNSKDTLTLSLANEKHLRLPCDSLCGSPCSQTGFCSVDQDILTYKDTLQIDTGACCSYALSYFNPSSRFAFTPPYPDFYIASNIDVCIRPCHDGVHFDLPVSHFLHEGENHKLNFGGYSPQDDTVLYTLDTAYTDQGVPVAYSGNSTPERPFGEYSISWMISVLNTHTGTADFSLSNSYVARPVVIKATQYYNGQPYSITRQEVIFQVSGTNNNLPGLSGFNGSNETSTHFCTEDSTCVSIQTSDPDASDSLSLDWQSNLPPSAHISVSDSQYPELQICWAPTSADVPDIPYELVVSVQDDGCEVSGQTQERYYIDVREPEQPDANLFVDETCNQVDLWATLSNAFKQYDFAWVMDDDTFSNSIFTDTLLTDTGIYPVTFKAESADGCDQLIAEDTIVVPYSTLEVTVPADSSICYNDTITVTGSASGGEEPYSYQWIDGPGDSAYQFSPSMTNVDPYTLSNQFLIFEVTDASGCLDTSGTTISSLPLPGPELPATIEMCKDTATVYLNDFYSGTWEVEGTETDTFAPSSADTGHYNAIVHRTSQYGCALSEEIILQVNEVPDIDIDTTRFPDYLCENDTLELIASPGGGSWSGSGVFSQNDSYYFSASAVNPDTHDVIYTYTNIHGCDNSALVNIVVTEKPDYTLPEDTVLCYSSAPIELSVIPAMNGQWSGPGISTDGTFDPAAAGTGSHTLYYDNPAVPCLQPDSMTITVEQSPEFDMPGDRLLCKDEDAIHFSTAPKYSGKWSGPGINNDGVFVPSDADTGIHFLVFDNPDTTCFIPDSFRVTIEASPTYEMPPDRIVCLEQGTITFSTEPIMNGQWTGTGISSNGTFNPVDAGTGTHLLTFDNPDTNCFNPDSFQVTVVEAGIISFEAFPDSGHSPLEVAFTADSEKPVGEWQWEIILDDDTVHLNGKSVNHTFEASGVYSVRLSAVNNQYGCRIETFREDYIHVSAAPNFIAVPKNHNDWTVYPNPANEGFYIDGDKGKLKQITLYSLSGQKLKVIKDVTGNAAFVQRNDLTDGKYWVHIELMSGEDFYVHILFAD